MPYLSDEIGIYALHHKNKREYEPPHPKFSQTSTQDSFVCESCMSLDVFIFDLDTLSPHTHTPIDRLTDVLSLYTGTTSDYIHIPLSPTRIQLVSVWTFEDPYFFSQFSSGCKM